MKEQLKQIIAEAPDRLRARNLVREYGQARILQFLQESGVFTSWIFHGGTALRLFYGLPRYSEGLDFAVAKTAAAEEFTGIMSSVRRSFESETYAVEVRRLKENLPAKSAFLVFPGLYHELGLSAHRTETLSIKIELDSRPPDGGTTETTVIRRYVILNVLHYDKPSMLSGKLHAVFMRPYFKGRDLYDLFWYVSDPAWPGPNFRFLNEALRQTAWPGPAIGPTNWIGQVIKRLKAIDWSKAIDDVRPLIEREGDLLQLSRDNVFKLLEARDSAAGK